jgi:hypothetical protein
LLVARRRRLFKIRKASMLVNENVEAVASAIPVPLEFASRAHVSINGVDRSDDRAITGRVPEYQSLSNPERKP